MMKGTGSDERRKFSAFLKMDSVVPPAKSNVSGLVRTFAKVLRFRAGIGPDERIRRLKSREAAKGNGIAGNQSKSSEDNAEEKLRNRASMEALLSKLFASISSIKAAYAELQMAQSPYDADVIQVADETLVSELKSVSELKQRFLKKEIDPSPQVTLLLAELQEQQSVLKTNEILGKKIQSQLKLKESEITFLREKLEESDKQNRLIEKKLTHSGPLSVLDDLYLSGLNPNHFITVLQYTSKSIQSFVKLMIDQMKSAGWDLDMAANSIEPGVIYGKPNHKCYAFESFVCREMFDGFQHPNFALPDEILLPDRKHRQRHFFERFMELKYMKPMEFLAHKSCSTFGKFCRAKYLRLIHPRMESSFFGDLNHRSLVNTGGYPETGFFAMFAEMAKRVWLMHCLAFSFEPEAFIFQVNRGCRFSEVYMESVTEDAFISLNDMLNENPQVGFTVMPGFKINKTVIQCQVYLSPA